MNDLAEYMGNMINSIGGGSTLEEPTVPESWDTEKVNPILSEDNQYVPVPKGYTASSVSSENTVKDGFVIYENTNGEDKKEEVNEGNVDNARLTRNQFVWVPVANPSDMYGTDSSGKKWGKLYNFSSSGITPNNWTEQEGIMNIEKAKGFREPDVVNDDSSNSVTKGQLEKEFNAMIASVEKYGGFYIGRYETGNLSQEEAVVVKNNSNTGIENETWYIQYNKLKGIAANSNVTTTMIWGCQWDATLRWMYNSGNTEKKKYTYDGTGKGNYWDTNGNESIPTGTNDNYEVNNIYDMAGNVDEFTIEATDTSNRTSRGGFYLCSPPNYSSSSRAIPVRRAEETSRVVG